MKLSTSSPLPHWNSLVLASCVVKPGLAMLGGRGAYHMTSSYSTSQGTGILLTHMTSCLSNNPPSLGSWLFMSCAFDVLPEFMQRVIMPVQQRWLTVGRCTQIIWYTQFQYPECSPEPIVPVIRDWHTHCLTVWIHNEKLQNVFDPKSRKSIYYRKQFEVPPMRNYLPFINSHPAFLSETSDIWHKHVMGETTHLIKLSSPFYLQVVRTTFTEFDLGDVCPCTYAIIRLFDSEMINYHYLIDTFCGNDTADVVHSSSSVLLVEFTTYGMSSGTGFTMDFIFLDIEGRY